ncbi:MAG: type II secretion system F family protein [Haloplanus sp.]
MWQFLPLILVGLLVAPVALSPVSRRADLLLSRVALPLFGSYVTDGPRRNSQLSRLRATHVRTTHRVFAARTLLVSGIAGVVGSVLGVYVAAWLVGVLAISQAALASVIPAPFTFLAGLARLSQLTPFGLFLLFLFFGATVGSVLALGAYWVRWAYLDQVANARGSEIEATLPRTIAFVYALSRSGMPFPKILETLSRNEAVYGEAAREVGVAVRDMDAFSTDILTALQRTSQWTPSESFAEFSENLASVLGSGRSLSEFLREQYERYQEEAEAQQQQYLELVSTFAEMYVTVMVAGPLFLITVLVVIGLVIKDTLPVVRAVGYLGVPLASLAFVVYIDSMTRQEKSLANVSREMADVRTVDHSRSSDHSFSESARSDGGTVDDDSRRNLVRLAAYDRFRGLREWTDAPAKRVLDRSWVSLVLTVPLGVLWVFARSIPIPLGPSALQTLDHPVVEATVFVLAVYALLHELAKRRIRAIEESVPDFLDRMASVNEAGMTVVESLGRVAESDLGGLESQVERTWRDIQWGANAQDALERLAVRTRSRMVSQSVTLITNAMDASGDIAPVLHIAADEAQETRRLRRERRQEMLTYTLVIYISVFVFVGIIAALTVAFIPAVQQAGGAGLPASPDASSVGLSSTFGGIGDVNTDAYRLVFFHVSAIQALCSGLVAGQLAEGGIPDGVKHAAFLLAVTYVAFAFI